MYTIYVCTAETCSATLRESEALAGPAAAVKNSGTVALAGPAAVAGPAETMVQDHPPKRTRKFSSSGFYS